MNGESSERHPAEQVADEFIARYRRGERPSVAEYAQRYPEWAGQLQDVLPAMLLMEELGPDRSGLGVATSANDASSGDSLRQLGDFRIIREVGRGGMGVVYEAEQESLGRHVALKILPFQALMDPTHLQRFLREARAAASLHHTNIVPVFGVGEQEGVHYFAMQFIQGQGLDEILRQVRLFRQDKSPVNLISTVHAAPATLLEHAELSSKSESDFAYFRRIAEIGVQVADALAYAHGQGILHRDIKPSNLLLDKKGIVWITDFGLAKTDGTDDLTGTGDIVGTLRYMAPERLNGWSDTRTDVYSLGLTLYELLTLHPAFDAPDRNRLMKRIADDQPINPRKLDARIPRDFETVILKSIAKEPGQRYASAGDLAQDLRLFLADRPIHARRAKILEQTWRWCRRNRLIAALSALALVIFFLGFASVAWQWQRAEREKQAAGRERDEADKQRARAQAHYQKALAAVDRMLTRVGEKRLADIPQMEEERRKLLEDALEFYRGFLLERGDDPKIRRETGQAFRRTASIYALLGEMAKAEDACRQALRVQEQLATESPNDADYRGDLAAVLYQLADLHRQSNRSLEAEAIFRRTLNLLDSLASQDSDKEKYQSQSANVYVALAMLYREKGSLQEAEAACRKGLAVVEALARDNPGSAEYQATLARLCSTLGLICNATGRAPEAEASYQKAIAINRQLVHDFPGNSVYQKSLAKAYNNLGLLYDRMKEKVKAEQALGQSLSIHEKFLRDHPRVLSYALDVGGTLNNLGDVVSSRSLQEGLDVYDKGIRVLEPALVQEPRHTLARYALFSGLFGRGLTLLRLDRRGEAERDWKRMIEISEGESHINMRLYRPPILARLGEHVRATDEVKVLLTEGRAQGLNLYNFAYVHALCAEAAGHDSRLPQNEREKLAEKYGVRAVELLTMATAAGYFKDAKRIAHLKTDKDMNPIRAHADFQKFMAALESQAKQ